MSVGASEVCYSLAKAAWPARTTKGPKARKPYREKVEGLLRAGGHTANEIAQIVGGTCDVKYVWAVASQINVRPNLVRAPPVLRSEKDSLRDAAALLETQYRHQQKLWGFP